MITIGCKGKYAEWLTDDGLLRVEGWARDGLTDEQIANNIGVKVWTLYDWQKRFPQFSNALKRGKAPVDVEVENALLKSALGFEYEETITEIEELPGGKQKKQIRKVKKYAPPNSTAQIFWLKNRRPDRWRDKQEITGTVEPVQIVWGKE